MSIKYYTIKSIQDYIEKYCQDCLFVSDSVVGLGHQIWTLKTGGIFEVIEHYQNCWSSVHSVRKKSKLSKSDLALIEDQDQNLLLSDD